MLEDLLERIERAIEEAERLQDEAEVTAHIGEQLRGHRLTTRCAWCSRYRVGERWLLARKRDPPPDAVDVSHGICPDCLAALRDAGLSA
jgi:hypothetical protein